MNILQKLRRQPLLAILVAVGLSWMASTDRAKALFTSTVDRLQSSGQSVPVISACGGTVAPAAGSNDMAGEFTVAAAGCTVTFGTAYVAAPSCTVTEETINTAARTTTVSATAIVIAAGGAASKYSYVCVAKAGG